MQFIIKNKEILDNCIKHLSSINPTEEFIVEIKPYERIRSKRQNSLMWMWIATLSRKLGYNKDWMHNEFKLGFIGEDVHWHNGKMYVFPKSTTELTVKEMTEYLMKIEQFAYGREVGLPIPQDYDYIMKGEK